MRKIKKNGMKHIKINSVLCYLLPLLLLCSCKFDSKEKKEDLNSDLIISQIECFSSSNPYPESTSYKIILISCDTTLVLKRDFNRGLIFDSIQITLVNEHLENNFNKSLTSCSKIKVFEYSFFKPKHINRNELRSKVKAILDNGVVLTFGANKLKLDSISHSALILDNPFH